MFNRDNKFAKSLFIVKTNKISRLYIQKFIILFYVKQEKNFRPKYGQPLQFTTSSPTRWAWYYTTGKCYLKLAPCFKWWLISTEWLADQSSKNFGGFVQKKKGKVPTSHNLFTLVYVNVG